MVKVFTPYQTKNLTASRYRNAGFSILEVLIALAITSLASLALFQSMTAWFAISAKTTGAAQRALGDVVHDRQFRAVVGGLMPSWPEQADEVFIGKPTFFSGLTTASLHRREQGLDVVSLELIRDPSDTSYALSYAAEDAGWPLRKFYGVESANFSYLGADGVWYNEWPPATNPEPGPFNDAQIYPTPPLPLAIRMQANGTSFGSTAGARNTVVMIAPIESEPVLPLRPQDFLEGVSQGF